MSVILIAAVADNGVIGNGNSIPWRIKEDMQRFKKLTTGHPVIMGRKTYDSFPEKFRPLPERTNIVLTRDALAFIKQYGEHPSVRLVISLEEGLGVGHSLHSDIYIIGGGQVYAAALPFADKLELTRVHQKPEGDVFFPTFSSVDWSETNREDREGYSFLTYQNKSF